ncbi:tripartite-type tricarboxylate transporter receptor subunit TctC [Hoeflea marina]|uniref:Tripartite-type tricarboxylate transporter receptor subunit TctC n=1 Tax=Hoeflea marina TaxID=274592 RepID=A0A317PRY0_9HYPH|nr:tripartite tricarboxylate transporter substrate-binding protein [Hoeflea marina]PWW03495.1 tripartite-type tricarboxylate transporter receptor subunit TctC [Hoeflea marina]
MRLIRNTCHALRTGLAATVLAAAFPAIAGNALAADPVTLKVGFGPGGSYGAMAQLVAENLGAHLPGNPGIVVQYVEGAGSLKLAKMMAATEPGDGSVFGLVNPSVMVATVTDPATADFDPNAFHWIGSLADTPLLCVVRKDSAIRTADDLLEADVILGSTGKASGSYMLANMIKQTLGARYTVITGFKTAPEVNIAMDRGEIEGWCGITLSSFIQANSERSQRIVAQWAYKVPPEIADIPNFVERIEEPRDRAAAELLTSHLKFQLPIFLPPGTPEATVAEFRKAFDAMVADPRVLEEARKRHSDIASKPGTDVAETVRAITAADTATVERAAELSR